MAPLTDPDAPLQPLDPHADAQARSRAVHEARATRDRSLVGAVLLVIQVLLVPTGGALLGALFHGAGLVGLVGMLLVWVAARAVLLAGAAVTVALDAPRMWRQPANASGGPGRASTAAVWSTVALHGAALVAGSVLVSVACSVFGTGWSVPGTLAFAGLGALIAVIALFSEPG